MNKTPEIPDNPDTRPCPQCGQSLVRVGAFWVCPTHGQVPEARPFTALRIFLSYGHDENEELVRRIKADLQQRGHDVWFDKTDIKAGDDWRRAITDGILHSQRVVSFLSKHSTRDPGVCRDEIAIAIGVKGGNIQTILVESETEVQPPVNIGHIQWLDMHDWRERRAAGETTWEEWYQTKFAEIVRVVESDESRRFAGEIETLHGRLKPIRSDARIYDLLRKGFFGRTWLFEAVEEWRQDAKRDSRLFWIAGEPGVGKSAFAAQLAHTRSDAVIAAQFVEWDKTDHRDARRVVCSLAFQLATRLPDYRKLLLALPEIADLDRKDPAELFDYLLANPLRSVIGGGRERLIIAIDALDEAGEAGRNPLVEMLARNVPRLPDWVGLVVTSRPESAVQTPLQGLKPFVLDTRTEANRTDLREYLRQELAPQLHEHPEADRIIGHILDRSEGVFLYVERFCDDVQRGHLSLDRPEQFPQGLGGIFCQWFQRQFPDLDRFRKDVRPALRGILAAASPMPLEILQRLLKWEEEEVHDFTRRLGSLFPVSRETGTAVIRPYHKSLSDWIADEAKSGAHFTSVLEGHRMLAAQLEQFTDTPGPVGDFARFSLPHNLALCEEWPAFFRAMSDAAFLKRLKWRLPETLLQVSLSAWASSDLLPLEAIAKGFSACAFGVSLRAAGFPYLHEDVIESVRRSGPNGDFWVQRRDGSRMTLPEMEPDNDRMYEFISACRRMLRCAYDFSEAIDGSKTRVWLRRFLEEYEALKDELEDIIYSYDRTHFGPSLRAGETVFMWESMLSGSKDKEDHARSSY